MAGGSGSARLGDESTAGGTSSSARLGAESMAGGPTTAGSLQVGSGDGEGGASSSMRRQDAMSWGRSRSSTLSAISTTVVSCGLTVGAISVKGRVASLRKRLTDSGGRSPVRHSYANTPTA